MTSKKDSLFVSDFEPEPRLLYAAWATPEPSLSNAPSVEGLINVYLVLGWQRSFDRILPVTTCYYDDPHTTQFRAIPMDCEHVEFSPDPCHWDHYRDRGWLVLHKEGVPEPVKQGGKVHIRREVRKTRQFDQEAAYAILGDAAEKIYEHEKGEDQS